MPISANRPKTGRFKKFLGRNESAFNLIRKHFNDKNSWGSAARAVMEKCLPAKQPKMGRFQIFLTF